MQKADFLMTRLIYSKTAAGVYRGMNFFLISTQPKMRVLHGTASLWAFVEKNINISSYKNCHYMQGHQLQENN